jgi:hypothetical protein
MLEQEYEGMELVSSIIRCNNANVVMLISQVGCRVHTCGLWRSECLCKQPVVSGGGKQAKPSSTPAATGSSTGSM